jgi:hypothetical protein
MSRLCKVCARVNQKFWRYPKKRADLCNSQLMGHVTAQMFLQTSGDVAILGECRLIMFDQSQFVHYQLQACFGLFFSSLWLFFWVRAPQNTTGPLNLHPRIRLEPSTRCSRWHGHRSATSCSRIFREPHKRAELAIWRVLPPCPLRCIGTCHVMRQKPSSLSMSRC